MTMLHQIAGLAGPVPMKTALAATHRATMPKRSNGEAIEIEEPTP